MNRIHPFQTRIDLRFNDIDAMGHVNNAVVFTYFEEARKALFYDAIADVTPGGFNFIMAHVECDYLLPIRLTDGLDILMGVTDIGTKSFGLSYCLVDADDNQRVFARGSSIQVCYDYHQRQSIPVPDALRKALSTYFIPDKTIFPSP